jgi:hypothetical protein
MEMHEIRYFLAVCDTLNFTRAAERVNVTQPTLTRAIQKIEDELGGLLFRRERSRTHRSAQTGRRPPNSVRPACDAAGLPSSGSRREFLGHPVLHRLGLCPAH